MHQSQPKEIPSSFNLLTLHFNRDSSGSIMATNKSNDTLYLETHKLTVSTSNGNQQSEDTTHQQLSSWILNEKISHEMQSHANSKSANIIKLKICSKRQQNESVAVERYLNTNQTIRDNNKWVRRSGDLELSLRKWILDLGKTRKYVYYCAFRANIRIIRKGLLFRV